MTRPIKFRVFNTNTNKMLVGQDVQNFTLAQLDGIVGAEIMQFTGLLDKNGKEIYEGDLIGYWHKAFWVVGWSEEKGKYMFQYPGSTDDVIPSTGENLKGKDGFAVTKSVCSKKEIIGNIYENPSLLSA